MTQHTVRGSARGRPADADIELLACTTNGSTELNQLAMSILTEMAAINASWRQLQSIPADRRDGEWEFWSRDLRLRRYAVEWDLETLRIARARRYRAGLNPQRRDLDDRGGDRA